MSIYIDPFVAGVLATVLAELGVLIVFIIKNGIKNKNTGAEKKQ